MNETGTRHLSTPGDYAAAVIGLLDAARQSVDVFSQDFVPAVFARPELLAAMREFAFRNRHSAVRILVRDAAPLTRDDHGFLSLAQRISSKVGVRVLAPDYPARDDAFVVADGVSYAQRRQASNWVGVYDSSRPEVARQLASAFDTMWEHSLPDPGVRRLHI